MSGYDEMQMETAMSIFMKNEYWKEVYENAPSDQCRNYFRLGFFSSLYPPPDDYAQAKDALYDSLAVEDWEYLRRIHTGTPFVKICRDRIQALRERERLSDEAKEEGL